MPPKASFFDTQRAKQVIERGRRSKWWQRLGTPKSGFRYVDAEGRRITDSQHLERIRALVLPPAWKYVRISPSAGSRLQAVGMDTTGRVQYRYHEKFAARQQRKKFRRIEEFGRHLPQLRSTTNEHISLPGFPREKVLAIMMRLINSLYFRVGTDKSVKAYRTYGITTLRNKHLTFGPRGELIFEYVGKSHVKHRKIAVDKELSELMKELKALGRDSRLFHYLDDDGRPRPVTPRDLNHYLKSATAQDFSCKDFRTWGGTVLAAEQLAELPKPLTDAEQKKNLVAAVKLVAEQLGNTPSVCRSSYIHPAVIKAYNNGITIDELRPRSERHIRRLAATYGPEEVALFRLFETVRG